MLGVFLGRRKRIQELSKSLGEKLNAGTVAVEMYQRDALSLRELESIQVCKGSIKAADTLLKILLPQDDSDISDILDCFLESLKATGQEEIYTWICDSGNNCKTN